jgi:hypothetical protein
VTSIKGKVCPRTDHESPEGEQRYIFTLSLTSALDGCGWSTTHPGRSTPGEEPVSIVGVYEAGWVPGPVWTDGENLAPHLVRSPERTARSDSVTQNHNMQEKLGQSGIWVCRPTGDTDR